MRTVGRIVVWLLSIIVVRVLLLVFEGLAGRPSADWLYRELVAVAALAVPSWLIWRGP